VVAVFEERDPDRYALTAKIPNVPGSATSYFVAGAQSLVCSGPAVWRPASSGAGVRSATLSGASACEA